MNTSNTSKGKTSNEPVRKRRKSKSSKRSQSSVQSGQSQLGQDSVIQTKSKLKRDKSKTVRKGKIDDAAVAVPPVENSNDKPTIDDLKKSFCSFLEKTGIKPAILRSLVSLYEETQKPDDPVGYLSRLLGYGIPSDEMINKYQSHLQKLRSQYAEAKDENAKLIAMYLAKQVEHRKLVSLQQKCAEHKQRRRLLEQRKEHLKSSQSDVAE